MRSRSTEKPEPELTPEQLQALEDVLDELLAPQPEPEQDPLTELFGEEVA